MPCYFKGLRRFLPVAKTLAVETLIGGLIAGDEKRPPDPLISDMKWVSEFKENITLIFRNRTAAG
jgi:hypothetical protein